MCTGQTLADSLIDFGGQPGCTPQKSGNTHAFISFYHRCKKRFLRFFIMFIKNAYFNVFYFWNVFYFLVAKYFILLNLLRILLNLLNYCIKRLLSDGFNMAATKKFSHEES